MCLASGDLFGLGIDYLVVATSGSVWVIGSKAVDKIIDELS